MRCGEGFLICYSVTDRHSFQEAVEYKKVITRVRAGEDIPLVLVGNKYDLHASRKVSQEEGKALSRQFGCPFYETSAALRHYVDEAFHTLVREIRQKERMRLSGIGNPISDSNNKNGNNGSGKHSRWWRLRSIFTLVFKRKRHT